MRSLQRTLSVAVLFIVLLFAPLIVESSVFPIPDDVASLEIAKSDNSHELSTLESTRSGFGADKVLAATSMEMSITVAGSALWQGTYRAIGSGDYVYNYTLMGLQVVDMSTAGNPIVVGEYFFPSQPNDLQLVGGFLYAALGSDGVLILDVSDPTNPIVATYLSEIDILPEYGTAHARGIEIVGNLAYVSAFHDFLILDITDPYNATILNAFGVNGVAMDASVEGDWLYIASEFFLEIWNILDPVNPVYYGKHALGSDQPVGDDAYDVKVSGGIAYVASRDVGLYILDVTNPPTVNQLGVYIDSSFNFHKLELVGNYVYLLSSDTIQIIDVSIPYAPTNAGGVERVGSFYGIQVENSTGFVPEWSTGCLVYDVNTPVLPILSEKYETPGMGYDQELDGDYLYQANGIKGLQILNIADPENPVVVSSLDTPDDAKAIAKSGDYVFLAEDTVGLIVIDVSNPSSPLQVATEQLPDRCTDISISGSYAYLSCGNSGLVIFDISNPLSPTQTGSLVLPQSLYMALQDTLVYILSSYSEAHIVNIADPFSPILVGTFNNDSAHFSIAVSGDYMYLSQGYKGSVVAVDVSDPESPVEIGMLSIPQYSWARQMKVVGDYLYIAGYLDGLRVVNVSDPYNMNLAGNFLMMPPWAWDVDVVGNNIFVTADNGFFVFWKDGCSGPDGTAEYNVNDLTFLVAYVFQGGTAPSPVRVGDVDCSDAVNVNDITYMVDFLFRGGMPPCGGCY